MREGVTHLVSVNQTGEAAGAGVTNAFYPYITPDGRHVLFGSTAEDLVGNDANQTGDLFINVNLPATGQAQFAQHVFSAAEAAGPLGRDPDEVGYDFWLDKLEDFNGNYVEAEMVKAFISSDEYLKRFGQ